VRHWDTAQDYGAGHSEAVIGRYLSGHPGAGTVATKTSFCEPGEVRGRIEQSLRRLRVPVIDLFCIHWPRAGLDPAPMVEALEACRSAGLIRQIGVSNFSVAQMGAAARGGHIDDHQLGYSLAWRVAEDEVIPYCRLHGVSITVYSPLAQGLLSGRGRDLNRWGADDPRRKTVFYQDAVWPVVERAVGRMEAVAASAGTSLEDLALRWVVTRPGISRVLVGASTEAQLKANVESLLRADHHPESLEALEVVSSELNQSLPKVGNMFLHYP
jgi:aryl-alcohol dehydrogenase-like predicted oxidoreductase